MNWILDVNAKTAEIDSHFDLLDHFSTSAGHLYASAWDVKKQRGQQEYIDSYYITAFYLYRHAMELALKALVKEAIDMDINHHDMQKMWESIPKNYQCILSDKVNAAFTVLASKGVLTDEQLFRYHTDNKNGQNLKKISLITNEDFDALSSAVDDVRSAVMCCTHHIKKLPSEVTPHVSVMTPNGLFESAEDGSAYGLNPLLTAGELTKLGFSGFLKKAKTEVNGMSIKNQLSRDRLKYLLQKIVLKGGHTLFYLR